MFPGFPGFVGGVWLLLEMENGRRFAMADAGASGVYGLAEIDRKKIEDFGPSVPEYGCRYNYRAEPISWARTDQIGNWSENRPFGIDGLELLAAVVNVLPPKRDGKGKPASGLGHGRGDLREAIDRDQPPGIN